MTVSQRSIGHNTAVILPSTTRQHLSLMFSSVYPHLQECGSGFYRQWTGFDWGQCVPCSCNGLSNECDEHTGNCVNCMYDTTGDHCEQCKEGYYRNADHVTCRACPCPFTWNNVAWGCRDIGSGVVQCFCRQGYDGARCERCASGYYGNPMVYGGSCKPCNCKHDTWNTCDSMTGGCDICSQSLQGDLEKMDDVLSVLKQQLQNINPNTSSPHWINNLETNIFETKILVERYITAVRRLVPNVEQLEVDVNDIRDNMNQLTNKTLKTSSDLETIIQNVDGTKLKAEDLFFEAKALLITIQGLLKQEAEVKPKDPFTKDEKVRMMEEAEYIVKEMRKRDCTAQRDKAGSEQKEAHKLLDLINMTVLTKTNQPVLLNKIRASLMASNSSLRDLAELMSDAEDAVRRAKDLNLKSGTVLQHLPHFDNLDTLEMELNMTTDLLKNITDIFLMLEDMKKELEKHAAQVDGGKVELFKKLNIMQMTVAIIEEAAKHAEELDRQATEFEQLVHSVINSTSLPPLLHTGVNNFIINAIEEAEMAANQSMEAAERASKDVKEEDLVNRVEGLKDNSSRSQTEANKTQTDLTMLSDTVNTHKDRVNAQKEKGESLTTEISAVRDDLKKIKRNDTEALIQSAKTAASASNYTVSNIMERLRNISEELKNITDVRVNKSSILNDTDQALNNLDTALSTLKHNLTQVKDLSGMLPDANMTESIRQIKDLIEETRTIVNRVPFATAFNGKGHIELHPPRNLEDMKAFTAVDLLLNLHQSNPLKADSRRKRRQDKHKAANHFVFYLGNKNAFGDYIGMAIRSNVLIGVYKLGKVVHQVETSQITTTSNVNSSDFDRIMFSRVYQDAEVNITSFPSEQTNNLPKFMKRYLSNSTAGVLDLDPDSVVFYVGGYPEDFTPPVELHYSKYKGAMKLSYINNNPVCLFNYKHAANINAKEQNVKIPQSTSDYYEGTGYRMAFLKQPNKKKTRLFRFTTNSHETNALLFYIGNEESFIYVFVEKGHLKLQGQQAGQVLTPQKSGEKVSLIKQQFTITISMTDKFEVHCGKQKISTEYIHSNYTSYYIGGLPVQLRQRHNIIAPPLRGCVEYLQADGEAVEYNTTIGVSAGCPLSLLGVREATLYSALSLDSLFVWNKWRVSLGFRSKGNHGDILRSSSQDSTSVDSFQLSLSDGFLVFSSNNHTLKSDKRYNDGSWHYLSAVRGATELELNIDNENVTQGLSPHISPMDQNLNGMKFQGCIANLYARQGPDQSVIPADLSSLAKKENIVLGLCSLTPLLKRTKKHKHALSQPVSQCRDQRAHHNGYSFSEADSWLSYILPQEDLNHRPHFSLEVKTYSHKGLLLHVLGGRVISVVALYISHGKIKLSLGDNRTIYHKRRINDGEWHKIELSVEMNTYHLLVDGTRADDGRLPNNDGLALDLYNPVYLGGDPLRKIPRRHSIPRESIIGCLRNFRLYDDAVGKPGVSHKASPCLDGFTEMGTYFSGGHIILDNYFTVGSQFVLTFELRPQHMTGLLFHVKNKKASLNVFLMDSKVGVKMNDGNRAVSVSVTPLESLCDGKFHMITVSKEDKVIKLKVDSVFDQREGHSISTTHSTTLDSLYIGGTTKQNQIPVSAPFVGCLRNVKVNGTPVAFETASRVVGHVNINKCPVD
ncbi:laminin subunit alpha-3 [Scomber japonicus]|uniref:laminin subunit alpha-3 n=1 Tax=Scomber japonicus TaxID=13676 RepID=UPI0023068D32|nr:laminin subunit alpha-3 [Scomber japonicus]